jgi:hypothetical protein
LAGNKPFNNERAGSLHLGVRRSLCYHSPPMRFSPIASSRVSDSNKVSQTSPFKSDLNRQLTFIVSIQTTHSSQSLNQQALWIQSDGSLFQKPQRCEIVWGSARKFEVVDCFSICTQSIQPSYLIEPVWWWQSEFRCRTGE